MFGEWVAGDDGGADTIEAFHGDFAVVPGDCASSHGFDVDTAAGNLQRDGRRGTQVARRPYLGIGSRLEPGGTLCAGQAGSPYDDLAIGILPSHLRVELDPVQVAVLSPASDKTPFHQVHFEP